MYFSNQRFICFDHHLLKGSVLMEQVYKYVFKLRTLNAYTCTWIITKHTYVWSYHYHFLGVNYYITFRLTRFQLWNTLCTDSYWFYIYSFTKFMSVSLFGRYIEITCTCNFKERCWSACSLLVSLLFACEKSFSNDTVHIKNCVYHF